MSRFVCLLCTTLVLLATTVLGTPRGHLGQLGEHRDPDPPVETFPPGKLPSPEEFYNRIMKTNKPVIFRGAAKKMPAFTKWTDSYMLEKYGNYTVRLEKKNESQLVDDVPHRTSMNAFFQQYQDSGYVITQLPSPMSHEMLALPFMTCGTLSEMIVELNLWISSGATHSLLHKDSFNQVNCLLKGQKKWIMIDPEYGKYVYLKREDSEPTQAASGFSLVKPTKVDLKKFPLFSKVRYQKDTLEPGDCIYMPGGYLHQVISTPGRNLALSTLFAGHSGVNRWLKRRMRKWENFNCTAEAKPKPLSEMYVAWDYPGQGPSTYGFAAADTPRDMLLEEMEEKGIKRFKGKEHFLRVWLDYLRRTLGTKQEMYLDDMDSSMDSLVLLTGKDRKEFEIQKLPRNKFLIKNLTNIVLHHARIQAGQGYAAVDPQDKGLSRKDLRKLRPRQVQAMLKAFFYVEGLESNYVATLGDEGGDDEADDDEDAFAQQRGGGGGGASKASKGRERGAQRGPGRESGRNEDAYGVGGYGYGGQAGGGYADAGYDDYGGGYGGYGGYGDYGDAGYGYGNDPPRQRAPAPGRGRGGGGGGGGAGGGAGAARDQWDWREEL